MRQNHETHVEKGLWALGALICVFVLSVSVYIWLIEISSQRGLREIKQQMRAEGLPLGPADLNRPLPPADQNAAPLYVQLSQLLTKKPLAGEDKVLDYTFQPTPEHIAQVRRALQHRQDILTLVHQAAQRPQCVFQRDYALGPYLLFPEYKHMRAGLRVLSNESLVLLADGKPFDAIRNESVGYRMAQHASSDAGLLLSKLVGIALNAITDRFMERVLYTCDGEPGIAQAVAQASIENWQPVSMADGMRSEIVMHEVICDMLREGKTSLIELTGVPTKEGQKEIEAAHQAPRKASFVWKTLIDSNELNMLRYMRKQKAAMTLPYREGKSRLDTLAREAESHHNWPASMLTSLLMPEFGQANAKQFQGEARRDVTRAAAMVMAYKQQHGAFPDRLEQALSPVPTDPFNGKPLGYRRDAKGFVVYSVGDKLNFDGGERDMTLKEYQTYFWYPMPAHYTRETSPSQAAAKSTP